LWHNSQHCFFLFLMIVCCHCFFFFHEEKPCNTKLRRKQTQQTSWVAKAFPLL
jgi:hypothetical protein